MVAQANQNSGSHQWLSPENFYRFVLFALLLRVLLMPFFGHVDVLSEARRIYFWDISGIYFDDISRNATSIFQLFFFKLFSWMIESKEVLFAHADMANSTARPNEYFEFVSHPEIYRALFVIKLPFLAADLITAWALYRFCGSDAGAKRATLLWLFNPITIFAFYIFGRFESIPIMFCMLAILAVSRQRILLGALMVGLSMNSRELFILLGPVFIALMFSKSAVGISMAVRLIASSIVLFALAVSLQLISLTGSDVDTFGREVSSIATEGRVEYLFRFIVGSFLVFPMAFFAALLFAWNSRTELNDILPLSFMLVLFAFFLFSSHTAHYTSWLVIFPCIYFAKEPRLFRPVVLLCITWIFYNLAITDLGVFTTWLASPWSIHFAGLPHFPGLYTVLGLHEKLDLLTYGRVWSTFYRACILYLGVQICWSYWQSTRSKAPGSSAS